MRAVIFPGQGAQVRGMGQGLFDAYPDLCGEASEVLGYSIRELCLSDPRRELGRTEFTQPALYVVGALAYLRWREENDEPAFLAGHSLGEYTALYAAGAFDFATGLRLVRRRGELMSMTGGGGMVAVTGVNQAGVAKLLDAGGFDTLTVANDNSPVQSVVSGDTAAIEALGGYLTERGIRWVRLRVSGAFHSTLMRPARDQFREFLAGFRLGDPRIPVIANATARAYPPGRTAALLTDQIVRPVRWTDSVRHLLDQGVGDFVELGGRVLGKLVEQVRSTPREPAPDRVRPETLGAAVFRERHSLRYAYVAGGMYRAIASPELVVRLARAGMLGVLGTGGCTVDEIEQHLKEIERELGTEHSYAVNLIADHDDPTAEREMVDLLLRRQIRIVEASAFIQMTPGLVRYRALGMRRGPDGRPVCDHRILAKVSRPEVASAFLSPAPDPLLDRLRAANEITAEQAELARGVPMSHDITVEADSGGHTDGGVATVLLPAMLELRRRAEERHRYAEPVCMGLAGGLGTPTAVAAAFMMGADYVLTGSVNQCTVEAATSDLVKDMLQEIDVQDTDYAPAGDMFELGSKVQVLRRGVFFPPRANKLFALYSHYGSLAELPAKTRTLLEKTYFRKPLDQVWAETCDHLRAQGRYDVIEQANAAPKRQMALVFRRYFGYSARIALAGQAEDKVNFQVHTGPALGSFNQWVKGTPHESWRHRHVDEIAWKLLDGAAEHITAMSRRWHPAAPVS
ncbi:ACP S-malonyltransferase [Micromonospora sp. HUAS LYJ1]|uniref:ACP S-malonyltransferase n=1 Tax=Micromonospora sp. HUAS LYJ1 TaxID=3061626 RepID=UPI00267357D0|nr:ACP S-malonyltransferase [Micromonospora sp. HUAS LYJ1]WKU05547.1 ACP S-malonyltransferase [Micromonospora sp. HUAS LYJ1]